MHKHFPLLLAALLLGCVICTPASAHGDTDAAMSRAATAQRPAVEVGGPLAARYALQVNEAHTDWYLWRQAEIIETANPRAGQGSIWERVGDAGYHYRRVFHADRRIVDTTPGELKTRNAEPDWEKLASVISPRLLDELRSSGRQTLFGQPATHYVGQIGTQHIDLWWLEKSRLPARLQVRSNGQRMRLNLRELHGGPPSTWPATWPRASEEKIADYGQVDAADFGDMESDPFVAKVMQIDGQGHAHSH